MPNFDLRLFNMPAERLFNPRRRLRGIPISNKIICLIPFKEELFEKLNQETDCVQLLDFFNDFGFNNFDDLKEFIENDTLYSAFAITTKDANTLGKLSTVLKYLFTVKRLLQFLVADDTVLSYHLPFLAEAVYDLECSFYLMKGEYFKQSLQTLRNVLELVLLHAYLGIKYLDGDELNKAMYQKYPSLKEMIVALRSEELLTNQLEQKYFQLYKNLSAAVHSEVSKLTVFNSFQHTTSFSEWYKSFTEVAVLNIQTILRMIQVGI